MGKTTPTNGKKDGDLASELLASNDPAHGDNGNLPVKFLTDFQKLLTSMEAWIITSLVAQISADYAAIAKHDQTIQGG